MAKGREAEWGVESEGERGDEEVKRAKSEVRG
jgi:hypothetical protein